MNNHDDEETLQIDQNLTIILAEIYQWQNMVEQQIKGIYSELKQNQVLITHLLEQKKILEDRIHDLEGR